jgi:hypothetical protein
MSSVNAPQKRPKKTDFWNIVPISVSMTESIQSDHIAELQKEFQKVPTKPPDAHEIISIYTDKIIERVSIYTASWDPLEYPHTCNRKLCVWWLKYIIYYLI